ncbi:hypothetical protein, partial [Rhizobium sp. P40RR-XXII]|uniref:hypothetical protein n=1 Tax=Rhizobium sp. P40RR-XXII TaxID=2726739 RepID=UPI001FEF13B1
FHFETHEGAIASAAAIDRIVSPAFKRAIARSRRSSEYGWVIPADRPFPVGTENHISADLRTCDSEKSKRALEQFQVKCAAVFRQELRENKEIERLCDSVKS